MSRSRLPNRLHLVHHVFDVLPSDRWFSAWEVAALLYHDRGGFHRQQKANLVDVLDEYAVTSLLESRDDLAPCVLYRRCEVELPLPERDHSLLHRLHRHATRPMTHDDLWKVEAMRRLAPAIGHRDPAAGVWHATGQPMPLAVPPPASGQAWLPPTGEAAKVRHCPPAMAAISREPM